MLLIEQMGSKQEKPRLLCAITLCFEIRPYFKQLHLRLRSNYHTLVCDDRILKLVVTQDPRSEAGLASLT